MLFLSTRRSLCAGRLINEYLVTLGLLFLVLTGELALLDSVIATSSRGQNRAVALELAREGMEMAIADVTLARKSPHRRDIERTDQRGGRLLFSRSITVERIKGNPAYARATVSVDWEGTQQSVKLVRYVR